MARMPEHEKTLETSLSDFAFAPDDENPQPVGFIPVQALAKALEPLGFGWNKQADGRPLHKPHFMDRANEEIVRKLHGLAWNDDFRGFSVTVDLDAEARGRLNTRQCALHFSANFVDRGDFQVVCMNLEQDLRVCPRGRALVSLLYNQRFRGVEAFATACHNALGEDVECVPLEGCVRVAWHSKPGLFAVGL
jgi:hypothetical protein